MPGVEAPAGGCCPPTGPQPHAGLPLQPSRYADRAPIIRNYYTIIMGANDSIYFYFTNYYHAISKSPLFMMRYVVQKGV